MKTQRYFFLLVLPMIVGCFAIVNPANELQQTTEKQFVLVMQNLATAWNEGDAKSATYLFVEDAVYSEPPDKQLYKGRQALFEFFGGEDGRPGQMSMTWHHLAFNQETQTGFGEFSFTYGSTAHGIAIIRLQGEKISNWREYWYKSDLLWKDFVKENRF